MSKYQTKKLREAMDHMMNASRELSYVSEAFTGRDSHPTIEDKMGDPLSFFLASQCEMLRHQLNGLIDQMEPEIEQREWAENYESSLSQDEQEDV